MQIRKGSSHNLTSFVETRRFFGMTILMSNLKYPRVRMYWETSTRNDRIADCMTRDIFFRFFNLRNTLHINANPRREPDDTNPFWKVQPLLDAIRKACLKLPREEYYSVDEPMISFTGSAPAKQHIPKKPCPEGLKNFVICGISGRGLDFEMYCGKGTGISEEYKTLGLGGSVVMRLCESVPKHVNHKVVFDNYFTSIPLCRRLIEDGIHSLGVVNRKRMMGCNLTADKELVAKGRGSFDTKVTKERDVACVRWYDNGMVHLISSFASAKPTDNVNRWSKAENKHISVVRPFMVKVYNECMGGVDKMDKMLSLYKIKTRTKKWTVRDIMHFVDFALSNAWLEYRDIVIASGSKKFLDFLGFRNEVAQVLMQSGHITKVGRPRSLDLLNAPIAKKSKTQVVPCSNIRYDRVDHFPDAINGNPKACMFAGCSSRSRVKCTKCNVFLCLTKDKNCYHAFHCK